MAVKIGLIATAGGTSDAITATFVPAVALTANRIVFVTGCVPNLTTTPTLNANATGDVLITGKGGAVLKVGEILGACIFVYSTTGGAHWELVSSNLTASTLAQILLNGSKTGGIPIKSDNELFYLTIDDSIAMLYSDAGVNGAFAGVMVTDGQISMEGGNNDGDGNIVINSTNSKIQHSDLIDLDAPAIKLTQETANRFVVTDANKNIDTPYSLSTDGTLAGNSDTNVPSQKSVKTYVDAQVSASTVGLLDDRGNYNPSTNANQYPTAGGSGTAGAILKGDLWTIAGLGVGISGTMGTKTVTDGDVVRCLVDSPGQTESNWAIGETNIGYAAENQTNKTDVVSGNESSSTKYLSVKGTYDYLVGLVWFTSQLFGTWINGLTSKATPVDADYIPLMDSAATNTTKKLSWSNIKTTLKTYFDTLYVPTSGAAYSKYLGASFTPASGTNTTSEELLQSFQVAAGQINSVADYLEFYSLLQWNSSANSKNFKVYFSPTNSLSDVNKVQVAQAQQTTNTGSPFTRRFVVKSDTLIRSHTTATSNLAIIDVVTAGANVPTDITVPSLTAGFYVLISGTKALGTDTDTVEYSYLMKISS